ncbi:MAG: tyrosine-type recombinase/integrase [Thermodesulfobacteriota bacterium]|nr:tyrosine-type recombinase/integrase [Thermodesulfobacteriota bacterium]
MAILAECPICHTKQATKHKTCKVCGENLDKAKGSKRVKYWISYRMPDGKQRREALAGFKDVDPTSIEDAKAAEAKRKVQKREKHIFDIKPEARMTFQELTAWYVGLEKVKATKSFWRTRIGLNNFNALCGHMVVGQVKPVDLENYQARRKAKGASNGTVDKELTMVQTMINKAFDNDMVGGDSLKVFKRVKNLLKRGANARDRILSREEFHELMTHLPLHSKAIVATGFYTGMRRGEILALTWDKVDLKHRVIKLQAEDTKDNEPRLVPILDELAGFLESLPRAIHNNHVFLFKGKPVRDIRTALKDGCKKAGIPYGQKEKNGFVFHDLRHSFNTHMRKAGVPESVIMKMTGHSTRQMFDRYNTVDMEDARQAVSQLRGYFENVDQESKNLKADAYERLC